MKFFTIAFCLIGTFLFACSAAAQSGDRATVFGTISEIGVNQPIESASVSVKGTNINTQTNVAGEYSLSVPSGKRLIISVSRVGYKVANIEVVALGSGAQKRIDVSLSSSTSERSVEVRDNRLRNEGMIREDIKNFRLLPTTTGNLESVLPHIALGLNSGSGGELTSQYQVRGGNYDENLVYVNDFEIYRPQLIRAGQQEGLTFANPDLMRDLSFSSGGFEARYGDKMSSVLDIKYKRPDAFRASAQASFLGGAMHIEGSRHLDSVGGYRRFRYLVGARYKTTQYLLSSQDVKGEYTPNFADIQTYLTYDLSKRWQLGLMANYNASVFNFQPKSRVTAQGLISYALGVRTTFQGQERDQFQNGMGGLSLTYLPERNKNPYFLKFLTSRYQNRETEGIDIIGDYLIGEIETNLGSDEAGKIVNPLGTGTQQTFVRNYLYSTVTNLEHKGGIELQPQNKGGATHFLQWGAKIQREDITDKINEWERLDSALYSLPYDTNRLLVKSVLKTTNDLTSDRVSGYFQDTWTWRHDSVGEWQISAGVRANYWTLNKEATVSPRVQLAYKPLNWKNDVSFRLSGGLYQQPPFYRELRQLNGVVNPNVLAQKSAHIVAGMTYDFFAGQRRRIPFKLIVEAYYKKLWDLVSYDVDNVRVRYSGNNDAEGYIAGLDVRVNGEFVPGAESWINLSLLQAREHIIGVQHKQAVLGVAGGEKVDYVPRPTDQLMTLAVFFQDYLPKNKNFKMHLNTVIGTGLPFGFPGNVEYRNTYRYQAYHRVDLGFSILLWDREQMTARHPKHFLRFTRNAWASLEVFNLMEVSNEASKTWIKTIYGQQFAIANYLTSRRINLRLRVDF